MRVPPEIDELMWQIAEADDQEAITEFEVRYPEFGSEMAKRITMVRNLKGSRPAKAVKRRDRFMPSRQVKNVQNPVPAWALALVAVAAMAGVSFATYGVAQFLEKRNQPTTPVIVQKPDTALQGNQGGVTNVELDPQIQDNPPINQPVDPNAGQDNQAPPDPFDTPVTVVASKVELRSALYDVATQAGVEIELAPGFPDQEIYLDYRGVPAIQVLKDLGRNFGFTPFTQTPRKALLIPAVDGRYNEQTGPGGLPGLSGVAKDDPRNDSGVVSELPF